MCISKFQLFNFYLKVVSHVAIITKHIVQNLRKFKQNFIDFLIFCNFLFIATCKKI